MSIRGIGMLMKKTKGCHEWMSIQDVIDKYRDREIHKGEIGISFKSIRMSIQK